ncbi:DUF3618 domain-containing protein [Amaricoccus solimangrovi]|uniref:DUF3618 domain-containing protein n=1 Tax=Amaricoccus solimangrovi TaxID=2589815 RepID=A0A501WQC3_9RHOB|nr:DUF3618 domain-containing protein [Amaricoccus solimangrovi]TPE51669.1 DUF3618 domain-containing protein [Amaricoccus solimangrovi]
MAQQDTDPGTQDSATLEREVNRERERVAETIDALQRKVSPGNMLDQVVKVVSENGGDLGRNLGRSLRDNPLPALLTGVGLVWLMAGSGTSARRDYRDEADWYRGNGTRSRPYGSTEREYGSVVSPVYGSGGADTDEPGLAERASDAAGAARDTAAEWASSAGEALSQAGDAVRGAGRGVRHGAERTARGAWDAGHGVGRGLGRAGHAAGSRIGGWSDEAGDMLGDLMRDQPLLLGALALAVGAAFGGALPSSEAEDRLLGSHSDRVKKGLRDLAEEEGEKAMATARAVADEAADIAQETLGDVNRHLPEASDMKERVADRVAEASERLRDAGSAEAERRGVGDPR